MPDTAIKIENISKAYRIGLNESKHDTLGGAVISWLKSPLTNYSRLRGLSRIKEEDKSEDIIWAVKDISFEVKHGEVIGIIGKNGAGKSTLLKIISNITEPTTGRIDIYGRVASLLEVGTGFNPELTGRENVYLNGTILGMTRKEIDSKFDEIVDFSGVEKFIDTPVKRYSSGMKVRLAFAVAAHLEPEILIVDEVLAVGDAEFQRKCLGKMEDITGEGRTILFVSHNMSAVKNLCKKGILLKGGKITSTGPVEKVIDDYMTGYKDIIVEGVIPEGFPRNDYNKGYAHFTKILLKDNAGSITNYYSYHQEINAELTIEVKKEIKDGTFIILVGSSNDDKISYSSTGDKKNAYVDLAPGIHQFNVKLKQNFLPGTYFITLVLMDNQGFPYDNVANVVDFHVGNMRESEEAYYRWGKVLASVNMDSEWVFQNGIKLNKI